MLQKIVSKRVELPTIYLVENEDDFNMLPKGLPYIIGTQKELSFIRIFLEFQVFSYYQNLTIIYLLRFYYLMKGNSLHLAVLQLNLLDY